MTEAIAFSHGNERLIIDLTVLRMWERWYSSTTISNYFRKMASLREMTIGKFGGVSTGVGKILLVADVFYQIHPKPRV
jgi:hypothetical protein